MITLCLVTDLGHEVANTRSKDQVTHLAKSVDNRRVNLSHNLAFILVITIRILTLTVNKIEAIARVHAVLLICASLLCIHSIHAVQIGVVLEYVLIFVAKSTFICLGLVLPLFIYYHIVKSLAVRSSEHRNDRQDEEDNYHK